MPITPQEALQRTIEHREVFHDEMLHIVRLIMSGECSPVMMAALITGLRVKKETIGEITAAAQVMREVSTKVPVADTRHLVDIVGTGGDGSHTFNISTCAMFVAAAAGAKVSKHGGRSVSSKSGSADVLESLGVEHPPVARADRAVHRRGRHRLHVRAQPSSGDEERRAGAQGARHQDDLQHPRAADQSGGRAEHPDGRVPSRPGRHPGARAAAAGRRACAGGLRARRHGRDFARRGDAGRRTEATARSASTSCIPKTSASPMSSNRSLRVETPERIEGDAARRAGQPAPAPARDIVILNAGAALYAADVVDSIAEGVERARAAIECGAAKAKLAELVKATCRQPEGTDRHVRHPRQDRRRQAPGSRRGANSACSLDAMRFDAESRVLTRDFVGALRAQDRRPARRR